MKPERKVALAELIAAVDGGGTIQLYLFQDLFNNQAAYENCAWIAYEAFYGSLDAALVLHNAVLPIDWTCELHIKKTALAVANDTHHEVCGQDDNPARAWLLAILRALYVMETA